MNLAAGYGEGPDASRGDTVEMPRCQGPGINGRPCGKLLAFRVTAPWDIRCPRCKTINSGVVQAPATAAVQST